MGDVDLEALNNERAFSAVEEEQRALTAVEEENEQVPNSQRSSPRVSQPADKEPPSPTRSRSLRFLDDEELLSPTSRLRVSKRWEGPLSPTGSRSLRAEEERSCGSKRSSLRLSLRLGDEGPLCAVPLSPTALRSSLHSEAEFSIPLSPTGLRSSLRSEAEFSIPLSPTGLRSSLRSEAEFSIPDDSPRAASSRAPSHRKSLVQEFTPSHRDRLYEKLGRWERAYTVGFFVIALDFLFVLRWPQYYWIWHLAKACFYLPWSYLRFRPRNKEWLMFDFAYFVTYYMLILSTVVILRGTFGIVTIFHRYNAELFRIGFAIANGSLALAVPVLDNKIVFHDVGNTMTFFIHFSPAVCFWALRWGGGFGTALIEDTWPTYFEICENMYEEGQFQDLESWFWYGGEGCAARVSHFVIWPAAAWFFLWGMPYYLIVLKCLDGWLKDNRKVTLYKKTLEATRGAGWFVKKAPDYVWREIYMVQHFLWTVLCGLLSIVLWHSFFLHSAYLLGIFFYAFHNGSTYIFRVVAARHVHNQVENQAVQAVMESLAVNQFDWKRDDPDESRDGAPVPTDASRDGAPVPTDESRDGAPVPTDESRDGAAALTSEQTS